MSKEELIIRYSKYAPSVREWMSNLIEDLYDDMNGIPASYIMQLDLLAQSCEILMKAKAEIDKNGIVVEDSRHGLVKNSACAIWNSANLTICKLLNQFAATRMAKSKLKENKDAATVEDLIRNLTD